MRLYSNPQDSDVEPFHVGAEVLAKIGKEPNGNALLAEGQIISIPTPIIDFYRVHIIENQDMVFCKPMELIDPDHTI